MCKYEKLIKEAKSVEKNCYSPYSNFNVCAAVELSNGKIITGVNVENASYGLTNCAERTALFSTYSLGYSKKDIVRMVVLGDTLVPISPCGACRQVMQELIEENVEIVLGSLHNEKIRVVSNKDLLPFGFKGSDLNE